MSSSTSNHDVEPGEECQRCGERGEDRRTLWMACLYQMSELGLPFSERQIMGVSTPQNGTEKLRFTNMEVPTFADPPADAKPYPNRFYTLRVCKDCRGDWMGAIKAWFGAVLVRESCGSGIFVRENGSTVEITEEEWRRRNPDREPVRFLP